LQIVDATFALNSVITNTPRKLKIAAIIMTFSGFMARVETQVAIAFGASVHPLTKITPSVRITVRITNREPTDTVFKTQ